MLSTGQRSILVDIDEFGAERNRTEALIHTEWWHTGTPRMHTVLQNSSPVKLRVIFAYDVTSVIVCHFSPHDRTVITLHNRDFLVRQVRRGIQDKCSDRVDNAILLHDNAISHKAGCVWQLL
ncbi:histone-lysine N-methyltransferase SETMAR [Trichonephila clavipes]|nr:histone-lysine N-methyltransferase SETMAR [Trichonephila clavipes]